MQHGSLPSVVDCEYPCAELPAAATYQEAGRSRGKVVTHMPTPPSLP
ncbi:hypothetical protein [Gemmatimonas sp.]